LAGGFAPDTGHVTHVYVGSTPVSSIVSISRYLCVTPIPGWSQRRMPPKLTSPTRSPALEVPGRDDRCARTGLRARSTVVADVDEAVEEEHDVRVALGWRSLTTSSRRRLTRAS